MTLSLASRYDLPSECKVELMLLNILPCSDTRLNLFLAPNKPLLVISFLLLMFNSFALVNNPLLTNLPVALTVNFDCC
ncbi:Uncharacterised protein [Actinobacillus equuli]|nr:Uncharacterised protein [Actinobacillus equuli]